MKNKMIIYLGIISCLCACGSNAGTDDKELYCEVIDEFKDTERVKCYTDKRGKNLYAEVNSKDFFNRTSSTKSTISNPNEVFKAAKQACIMMIMRYGAKDPEGAMGNDAKHKLSYCDCTTEYVRNNYDVKTHQDVLINTMKANNEKCIEFIDVLWSYDKFYATLYDACDKSAEICDAWTQDMLKSIGVKPGDKKYKSVLSEYLDNIQ
jgi:hypothetical protein